ncbi:MAG: hypothetical protein MR357_02700 [Anaeroplasma sp.]|nr:hypothetical protein [Anaeroplasma sp.]
MKLFKKVLSVAFIGMLAFTFTSCSNSTKRNTIVPYGSINTSNPQTVASIKTKTTNTELSLNEADFYTRLRKNGYDVFTEELKALLYEKELNALKALLNASSVNELTNEQKEILSLSKELVDGTYYVNHENVTDSSIITKYFDEIKEYYSATLSKNLATKIYGYNSLKTYESKEQKDIDLVVEKYIESMARIGITITKDQIVNKKDTDKNLVLIDYTKLPEKAYYSNLITLAENIYSSKKLFEIADLEYLHEGTDEETKNTSYYLFKDETIESSYDSSYKTYGTYRAIILTFNSRREALNHVQKVLGTTGIDTTSKDTALNSYISLYNSYYAYRGNHNADSDEFKYTINEYINDLDDISASINTLITETLDNGEYLSEPRNIDNKYVLAYRIDTNYDWGNSSSKTDLKDLSTEDQKEVKRLLQQKSILNTASSYASTAFKELIKESNLEIYDPYYEYQFRNSYSDYYELSQNFDNNLIFKFEVNGQSKSLTVDNFYKLVSAKYGASIITEYFQLEYAYLYKDEYVENDTIDSNKETIENALKEFNKNNNQTYPKEIGEETFLFANYGYNSVDNVLKYYFTAKACLSAYKAQVIFDSWATEDHNISDDATKVLDRILAAGNAKYSELFNIDIDHILINIDDDGDGSPDDPEAFIATLANAEIVEAFKNAVANLAQAIYSEAIYEDYDDNDMIDNLTFIVKEFNKGSALRSNPNKTWDDYKTVTLGNTDITFHFLLTAEQLASSGDITQDSVNNFVVPFADYVREMYSKASNTESLSIDSHGNFFTPTDGKLTTAEDATKITYDTLCETVFGYHLIVLNSYSGPSSLKYTETNDTNGYQKEIEILISEGDDEDSDDDNIFVVLNSYNDNSKVANINQLFIYFVQSQNGVSSSLDSSINTILKSLFSESIEIYTSSNFQTILLLNELNISDITASDEIKNLVNIEKNYYINLVTEYEDDSKFASWIDDSLDWVRPEQK